jgi:hypothetical protein
MIPFLIALALFLLLVALVRSSRPRKVEIEPEQPKGSGTVTFYHPTPHVRTEDDEKLEKWVRENPAYDEWIYSKVAGVSFANRDGVERQDVVEHCKPGEMLKLIPEPKNRFDHNAVAVVRQNGEQLGYLNRRLAEDVQNWTAKGEHWQAMVTKITPEQPLPCAAPLHGVNLILLRSRQKMAQAS